MSVLIEIENLLASGEPRHYSDEFVFSLLKSVQRELAALREEARIWEARALMQSACCTQAMNERDDARAREAEARRVMNALALELEERGVINREEPSDALLAWRRLAPPEPVGCGIPGCVGHAKEAASRGATPPEGVK